MVPAKSFTIDKRVLTADTSIFIYAIDARDPAKHEAAKGIRRQLQMLSAPIGLQVIGECFSASVRRLKRPPWEAAQAAQNLLAAFQTFAPTKECVAAALAEAYAGRFSYWDALLLSSANLAGCTYILSEDMKDGARLGQIEIVNPFASNGLSKRAEAALASFGGRA